MQLDRNIKYEEPEAHSAPLEFEETKKGREGSFDLFSPYGRFRSTSIVTAKPTAIAMIMAMIPGSKY
jgi:hypothetical protein